MHVRNMTGRMGRAVANQFIVCDGGTTYFQSHDKIIVKKSIEGIELDRNYWEYSATIGRYRNIFLGETKKETQARINSGEYILTDLN